MAENTIVHSFNSVHIHQRVDNGYVNLNQMAEATGRRIDNWLANKSTDELIAEFERQQQETSWNSREFLPALITVTGRSGGTWAHPDIALQFAQWCSPSFALQVSRWVREWMTSGRNPLADIDRVGLRSALKDDSRLRACDQIKVYLEQIERYDDKKYRGIFYARFHDSLNKAITTETAKQMRERLSILLGKSVKDDELIRDYFPSMPLQHYISMCEASANLMLREDLHPLVAAERASEIVLPIGYRPTPINFVEHIKFVRQRLITGQGGFELPGF